MANRHQAIFHLPLCLRFTMWVHTIWRFIYCVCLYRSKKCSILNMYSDYRVCCVYSNYRHFAPLYPPTVIITHVLSRDKGFLWPPDTLFYILRTLSAHGDQTGRWLGPTGRMPIGRVVHTSTIFGRFAKEQCILIDWQWRVASISLRLCAKWTSQKWNTLTNWSTGLGKCALHRRQLSRVDGGTIQRLPEADDDQQGEYRWQRMHLLVFIFYLNLWT